MCCGLRVCVVQCHLLLSNPFNTYDSSIFEVGEEMNGAIKGKKR